MPTVLLVEDDELMREVLEEQLREGGCEVVVAADPIEAISAAERTPVDLVVCDVHLGHESGPRAVQRIRLHHPAVRTILMSGAPVAELGLADAVLLKPFSGDEMMTMVRRLCGA